MSDDSGTGCVVSVIGAIIDIVVVVVVMTMVCCGVTIGDKHYSFSCVSCEEGAIFESSEEGEGVEERAARMRREAERDAGTDGWGHWE